MIEVQSEWFKEKHGVTAKGTHKQKVNESQTKYMYMVGSVRGKGEQGGIWPPAHSTLIDYYFFSNSFNL